MGPGAEQGGEWEQVKHERFLGPVMDLVGHFVLNERETVDGS